jgi:hypothetical protein
VLDHGVGHVADWGSRPHIHATLNEYGSSLASETSIDSFWLRRWSAVKRPEEALVF